LWSDWIRLSKLKSAKDGQDFIDPVKVIADNVLRHPQFHEDVKQIITGVFGCASDALRDYDLYKKDHGLMDITDQETRILDMAINNDAYKSSLRGRIQMLMVDEFQDTSPIQLALFFALTELAGKSVWVGDPKQAIYAFRGTDPQLMNDIMSLIGNVECLIIRGDPKRICLISLTRCSQKCFMNGQRQGCPKSTTGTRK
jgi:ATP-dependent exoDNAse (exonuclease V) beta subunit